MRGYYCGQLYFSSFNSPGIGVPFFPFNLRYSSSLYNDVCMRADSYSSVLQCKYTCGMLVGANNH